MEAEDDRPIPASLADVEALNCLIFEQSRMMDTKTDNMPQPFRSVSPLDAIAKLLVSGTTEEATACAIQVDQSRNETILSIASTKSVQAETLDYLHKVFRQLQRVSIAQHKHDLLIRREDGVYLGYLVRMGKQNKLTTLQKQTRNVYRTVSMFTFDNFAGNILDPLDSGFNCLEEFYSCTQEVVSTEEYESREHLLTIRCLLRWIADNVLNHGKESLNRSQVLSLFLCAMKKMWTTFKKVAGEYNLRRELTYLSKISVNVIQTLERPFTLPNSLVDWTTIAQKTVQALKIPSSHPIRLMANHVPKSSGENKNHEILQRAHPACAIVFHFLVQRIKDRSTNVFCSQNFQNHATPFRSIGTSSEACNMCYAFFESLTASIGVNFRVTISHKDIFPWKFPVALEEGKIEMDAGFERSVLTVREKSCLARMKEGIAAEMFRLAARRYLLILLPEKERENTAGTSKRKREAVEDVQVDDKRVKRGRSGGGPSG
ncbi:hypothetical protein ACJ72_05246 [Emergomyces africanus]|uniref:Uncharacterized protein n=1 Tax=Emergomyces africanus TaxID=1955775 RepID=A0A1B7NUG6_9EURO|nr:hypothetical protein ACJ72_05246 [Emergomyces africanus]